jgi:hypothetical protein
MKLSARNLLLALCIVPASHGFVTPGGPFRSSGSTAVFVGVADDYQSSLSAPAATNVPEVGPVCSWRCGAMMTVVALTSASLI